MGKVIRSQIADFIGSYSLTEITFQMGNELPQYYLVITVRICPYAHVISLIFGRHPAL